MGNVGVHLGAWAWAVFQGSHIPDDDWRRVGLLTGSGVRSVKYLLYDSPQAAQTQFEDIRRLRQERNVDEIVLRLMHGRTLPTPAEHIAKYRDRIQHAVSLGYRVVVQAANEPNIELDGMSPAQFDAWYCQVLDAIKTDCPTVTTTTAPMAPFNDSAWAWWDGTRLSTAKADVLGVDIYANSAAQLEGPYSLPWWLGQAPDKQIRVLECGAQTGTPATQRAGVLPWLYGQLARAERVLGFYPFIMSSEGAEHAEHWYTEQIMLSLRQCAQGQTPTVPESPPEPPVVPPVEPPTIPVGGRMRFMVTVERIE